MLAEPVLCSCTVVTSQPYTVDLTVTFFSAHRRLELKSDPRENNSHPCAQRTLHPFSVVFHACIKGLKEMKRDESKVRVFCGKPQISFSVGRCVAAKYTRGSEGHAEEGWVINCLVVSATCTEFSDFLFLKQW